MILPFHGSEAWESLAWLCLWMNMNAHSCRGTLTPHPTDFLSMYFMCMCVVFVCTLYLFRHYPRAPGAYLDWLTSEPSVSAYLCPPLRTGVAGIHIYAWLCSWVLEIWPWNLTLLRQAPHPLNYLKFTTVDRCKGSYSHIMDIDFP